MPTTVFFSGVCLLVGWLAHHILSRARRRRAILRREMLPNLVVCRRCGARN